MEYNLGESLTESDISFSHLSYCLVIKLFESREILWPLTEKAVVQTETQETHFAIFGCNQHFIDT